MKPTNPTIAKNCNPSDKSKSANFFLFPLSNPVLSEVDICMCFSNASVISVDFDKKAKVIKMPTEPII